MITSNTVSNTVSNAIVQTLLAGITSLAFGLMLVMPANAAIINADPADCAAVGGTVISPTQCQI